MFFDVLKTVMKLSLLMVVFLLAFGLGFNILLVSQVGLVVESVSSLCAARWSVSRSAKGNYDKFGTLRSRH